MIKTCWDDVLNDIYLNKDGKAELCFEVKELYMDIQGLKSKGGEINIEELVTEYFYRNVVGSTLVERLDNIKNWESVESDDILRTRLHIEYPTLYGRDVKDYFEIVKETREEDFEIFILSGKDVKKYKKYYI